MKRYGFKLGLLAMAHAAFAATGTLIISGRVTSPVGAPISGVKMTLTGAASKSCMAGANGAYSFTALTAGAYTLVPNKTGLKFSAASANLPKLRMNAVEDFSGSANGCQAPVYTPKAILVIYDPWITKTDGSKVSLSAYMTNGRRRPCRQGGRRSSSKRSRIAAPQGPRSLSPRKT